LQILIDSATLPADSESDDQSYAFLEELCARVTAQPEQLGRALPALLSHLQVSDSSDDIMKSLRATDTSFASRFTGPLRVLSVLAFPPVATAGVPQALAKPKERTLLASAAPRIFEWAAQFLHKVASGLLDGRMMAAWQVALRELLGLVDRHPREFATPEALRFTLELWTLEALDGVFFTTPTAPQGKARGLRPVSPTGIHAELMVLRIFRRCYFGNPFPCGKLMNRTMEGFGDMLAHVALRHVQLQLRESSVNVDRLQLSLMLIALLTLVPAFAKSTDLFAEKPLRLVAKTYRHLVVELIIMRTLPADQYPQFRAAVKACTAYLFAFFRREGAHSALPYVMDDLFVALCKTTPWVHETESDLDGIMQAQGVGTSKERVRFLQDYIRTHMWMCDVYEAVRDSFLHMNELGLGTQEVDEQILGRLNRYLGAYRYAISGEELPRTTCRYTQCPRAAGTGMDADANSPRPRMKRCRGCLEAYYCDATCQQAAWRATGDNHRSTCLPRTARMESELPIPVICTSCMTDPSFAGALDPLQCTRDIRFLQAVAFKEMKETKNLMFPALGFAVAPGAQLNISANTMVVLSFPAGNTYVDFDLGYHSDSECVRRWSDAFDTEPGKSHRGAHPYVDAETG
jgi:hypothetical protein